MISRPVLHPRTWWADAVAADRLVLAAKTAVAAVLAWYLAPWVPFALSEYSYYAPLGVLVSMYPTVARSATSGAQALFGLALGIGLGLGALGLVNVGLARGVAVAAVIALGVLAAGVRALGVGRDWVAIAALFVLLLGRADPDGYSVSYLLTMAFGVVVGVTVNLVVFPPLHVGRADERLTELRDGLAADLSAMADALSRRDFDPDRADEATRALGDTVETVRAEVETADESRRYNPRGRRRRTEAGRPRRRLDALAQTADATRTLVDALTRLTDDPDVDVRLPADARRSLAAAVDALARLVSASEDRVADGLQDASAALERYLERLDATGVRTSVDTLDGWEAAVSLRRMIEASRPFGD